MSVHAPERERITGPPRHDEPTRGIFEKPSGPAMRALAASKALIAGLAVLGAVLGCAYGLSRTPTYTASATLQVGQVNPNSPGFYGYVQSASALATTFSRAVYAEPVLADVRRDTGLSAVRAASNLSAEPIPVSPAFRVFATASSSRGAIALANSAAHGVISYEGQSNGAGPEASSLMGEYKEASLALQGASARAAQLEKDRRAGSFARAKARAERSAAAVRLKAIAGSYVAAVASQAPRSGLVSLLAGASTAASDRKSRTEMLALLGLLAGALVGAALALALGTRAKPPGS